MSSRTSSHLSSCLYDLTPFVPCVAAMTTSFIQRRRSRPARSSVFWHSPSELALYKGLAASRISTGSSPSLPSTNYLSHSTQPTTSPRDRSSALRTRLIESASTPECLSRLPSPSPLSVPRSPSSERRLDLSVSPVAPLYLQCCSMLRLPLTSHLILVAQYLSFTENLTFYSARRMIIDTVASQGIDQVKINHAVGHGASSMGRVS